MTDYPNNTPAKLEIIKASEIIPKEVRWLWYPYIPFGKVTLLQGDPGDGKSKLMLSLAALLSKGAPLPFADEDESGEPMTVIYQTAEDDADDTVVPRFNSAGGDGDRLIFIKEDEKSLTFGDDRIREAVEKYHAKLLILDPMSSYIGDTCSMNNANEIRAEFNHLIAVAKDTGCAIVIIAHMNKAKDTSPLYRTNGSIDIAGAARSILAVTRTANKQNPAERYLVQVKSNLAPMGSAILFEVADKGVNFLDELELSAEDAFSASAPRMGRPNAREEAATDFIRSLLAGGRRLASDCEAKLEAAGFKKSTYKKSKKKAGVRSVKDGFLWYWTLPEVEKTIENSVKLLELRERLKEYTGFDYSVIPESIVEAFIERIWVSKDEFRWYLRTGNNADSEFDPDDHIKIGAFTLTIDDAKKYIYSFSTRRRVYKWADLNVSVWI